jgi:poly(A) polymerase
MARHVTPENARQFALWVVQKLRDAGFEALWAGGCVRDELLGSHPSDYDVATSATPDEVRACFGRRRTLAIGAAFGVITVRGRRDQGQVEVATFRCDATYSDGRHPDQVTFSTAREDALRRDFTMNGLFYDPIAEEVIDYVDGRLDLQQGIVRSIGDPYQRIAEDKLRMLRAVRFATTFGFRINPDTLAAVQHEAPNIRVVSAERIAAELRKMFVHPRRATAMQLLQDSNLLAVILPESGILFSTDATHEKPVPCEHWHDTVGILDRLPQPTFRVALAGMLWGIWQRVAEPNEVINQIGTRWKLSNYEQAGTVWMLAQEQKVRRASSLPWPGVQRILIDPAIDELMMLAEAVVAQLGENRGGIDLCRAKLQLPSGELDPPPLINGDDLREAGFEAGPLFRRILDGVRDAQLEGQIASREEALQLARDLAQD